MKHPFLLITKATIFLLALYSCSDNPDYVNEKEEENHKTLSYIDITAEDFKSEADSKSTFNITENGFEFSWEKNDIVGIFSNTGEQVSFPISSGVGTNKASFTGGGWGLKSSDLHTAYFPYSENPNLNRGNISLDYSGQKQKGNSQINHLGTYDFMAASESSSSDGRLSLKLDHLNCLLQLKLTVPSIATFTSLTISSDEAIFTEKAKLNLIGKKYLYNPTSLTKELTMALDEISSNEENQVLTFYMMVGPVDMTGHSISIALRTNDDELHIGSLSSQKIVAGYAYSFSSTLENSESDNKNEEDDDSLTHIDIIAKDFKSETDSKSTINITENSYIFSWEKNDTVGVFSNVGEQACFPILSGAGTPKASFTGGGWPLKSSDLYFAYFPFINISSLDKEAITLDYTGQMQMEDSKTDHLSMYDFMAAPASSSTDGYVNFTLDHLGCLVQFKLTVPAADTFSSLTLSTRETIFTEKAKLNLVGESYSYTPTDMTQRLTITLDEISSETENQVLTFYMMVAPVDMTGHSITVTLRTNTNELYKGTITPKKMLAGYAYSFSSTLEGTNMESNVVAPDFGEKDNEI